MAEEDTNTPAPKVTPEALEVTKKILDPNESTTKSVHPIIHDFLKFVGGEETANEISDELSTITAALLEKHAPKIKEYYDSSQEKYAAVKSVAKIAGVDVDKFLNRPKGGNEVANKEIASNKPKNDNKA